jgi:hypothetical protein
MVAPSYPQALDFLFVASDSQVTVEVNTEAEEATALKLLPDNDR